MISDRGAKIAKKYNVYTFGNMLDISFMKTKLAIPSTFLINKESEILWCYIGARKDRPSIKILTNALDQNLTLIK
jgi:peroxiredoxin